ncbi:uncharacterized protein LOC144163726 [Haemaphysalis longicornis]
MELLKAPPPLQLTGNLSEQWKRFKQKFELFLVATTTKEQPRSEAAKAALLLSVAGDDALDVFNTFTFEAQECKEDYATVVSKFESYCSEVSNEVHERYVFRSRRQADGEPFEKFVGDLKKQAGQCNFGDQRDSMIRDQIVFGTNNPKLREKMLREQQLTLGKAEEFCKVAESVTQRNEVWGATQSNIDTIAGPAYVPKVYRKLRAAEQLTATSSVLQAYNGGVIAHFGATSQKVTIGNASTTVRFFVVKNGRQALLGLDASEALGLFQRTVASIGASEYVPVKNFKHLFQGLGCMKQPYSIVLQPTAVPVVQPARRVPLSLREPFQDELHRLERENIIVKENEPTDWVSPLVTVKKKDGRIRICMDPRKINEHIKKSTTSF